MVLIHTICYSRGNQFLHVTARVVNIIQTCTVHRFNVNKGESTCSLRLYQYNQCKMWSKKRAHLCIGILTRWVFFQLDSHKKELRNNKKQHLRNISGKISYVKQLLPKIICNVLLSSETAEETTCTKHSQCVGSRFNPGP